MVALPLGKLFYLLVRQIAKPLASRLKAYAVNHEFVKLRVLIPPARGFHRLEQRFKMGMIGIKNKNIPPLEEKAAVELGAELLSEIFIFSVGAICVMAEYMRQRAHTIFREGQLQERITNLETALTRMENTINIHAEILDDVVHSTSIENRIMVSPPQSFMPTIPND